MSWQLQLAADVVFVIVDVALAVLLIAILYRLEVFTDEVRGLRAEVRATREERRQKAAEMFARTRPAPTPPPPGEPTC